MSKAKKDNKVPRKPCGLIYGFFIFIIAILSKLLVNLKIKRDARIKKLKGPIVYLGTHIALLDVTAMMYSMRRIRRMNVVVARDVFSWSWIKPISKKLGFIPMSQFGLDIAGIKQMKYAVDAGRSIALYPEGKISLDGQSLHYLSPSLAKFLKMLGAHVVFGHNNGAYCNNPKWASNFRRGKIMHELDLLFTAEAIKEKSIEEIDKVIQNKFSFNENLFQQENKLRYRSKSPAKGLDYILYKCPKCMAEYENETDKKHIRCKVCGNTVEYNEYGQLIPKEGSYYFNSIDRWYDWQRVSIRSALEKESFELKKDVVWLLMKEGTNEYIENGKGTFAITLDKLVFDGEDNEGNKVKLETPSENQVALIQKKSEAIDMTMNNTVNRFMFVEKKYASKYNQVTEEVFRKIHGLPPRGSVSDIIKA